MPPTLPPNTRQRLLRERGSFLKLAPVQSFATVMLAWGALIHREGYIATDTFKDVKFKVKWGADYLMACHPRDEVFMGAMGNDTLVRAGGRKGG